MRKDELTALIVANLESLMEEKGLNPSGWAKSAGLNHTAVRDIVRGKATNPAYFTIKALADAAGVDERRLTVGPDYETLEAERAEALHVLFQLEPEDRRFLMTAAKARISDRDREPE